MTDQTFKDQCAIAAMQGLISSNFFSDKQSQVEVAFDIANAMSAERTLRMQENAIDHPNED